MNPTRGGGTKAEPRANARLYWDKAMRFAHAAQTNTREGDWDPAVANAVNAIINIVDALCVSYRGLRSASGSHQDALNLLDACTEMDGPVRNSLRKHLGAVLSQKTFAQYDSRLMEEPDAAAAISHMERAITAAKPVARGHGWMR